jgi:hypothetical protein
MVLTQNSAAAPLAKQIIALCAFLAAFAAKAEPCLPSFALSGLGETKSSRTGLNAALQCDSTRLQASGHLYSRKSREKGAASVAVEAPQGLITAGSQFLPFETSFLAESWAVLDAPLRTRRTVFAAPDILGLRPGLFGLEGSRKPGVFVAGHSFFAALHQETGLGALAAMSSSQFHRLLVDVTRLRNVDSRLTTEGYAGISIQPFEWTFDAEAERRMSWDLLKKVEWNSPDTVDPERRGRSGLISFGAKSSWLGLEAGGKDTGRTGMRAARASITPFPDGWILGPALSLRAYETRQYGEGLASRRRDSAAAVGPALRTEHLQIELLGEFRKKGAPGGEFRLTWKNRYLSAGLSAFASAVKKGRPEDVHMIQDGSPARASRRLYLEESAAMTLSLNAKWLYVYASAARTKGKSSLYLHGEGRFEL